jgi:hypothetical protein
VIVPVFARHETFHPRYGWIKKGFDAASDDPTVFLNDEAHIKLGVGKNMVRAIRYWCHAFKVLEEGGGVGRAKTSHPSRFGSSLLGRNGVDPYLEEPASLWLLHWNLLREPCSATAWWWTFFVHAKPELSADSITVGLAEYVRREFPNSRSAESSLRKDASCIVRMYGDLLATNVVGEESIHCPFAELGLLQPLSGSPSYRFRFGSKPGLADEIIVAACLQYAAAAVGGTRTISIRRLLEDVGSPGLAFKLPESVLYAALEAVSSRDARLNLSEAGGIVQLSFDHPPLELADSLLYGHYHSRQGALAV